MSAETDRVPKELACPKCGNDHIESIFQGDWVTRTASLDVSEDGKIVADWGNQHIDYDGATEPHLYCAECCNEWPIPESVEIEILC